MSTIHTIYLPDDWRPGSCDRCGALAPVIPELGADAENVCRGCLQQAFELDYREYRRLLDQHRQAC